jgi:membrane-associated phospholipid phosphatase
MNGTDSRTGDRPRGHRPYPHEVLTAGYLAVTGALGAILGHPSKIWPTVLAHTIGIIVILFVLPRLPQRRWVVAVRDWGLVFVLPFLYVEVAHLNRLLSTGYHDRAIQSVEMALFHAPPGAALRHVLPWWPVDEYLHFTYVAYYALLPLLGGALYFTGRRREFRYVLATVLGTFYVCYICFILYPVAGPWYHSPHLDTASLGHFFPNLVQTVLERAASKGAAFPSSHVAVAVVIWLLAWRFARRVFWILAAIVPALALGTVYGGFHYAVDAGAGLLVGVAGYFAAPHVHRFLGGDMPEPWPGGIEGA